MRVEHIFRVSAFTESQFDTTPATWVWTVEEEIDTIIDSAEGWKRKSSRKRKLSDHL